MELKYCLLYILDTSSEFLSYSNSGYGQLGVIAKYFVSSIILSSGGNPASPDKSNKFSSLF